jgi:hypothetical protein
MTLPARDDGEWREIVVGGGSFKSEKKCLQELMGPPHSRVPLGPAAASIITRDKGPNLFAESV